MPPQTGQTAALFFARNFGFADDRGVYRLEGLPPGQYFVGAIENHSGGNALPRDSAGLVTAYHPAAPNVSAATVVSVQAGRETRDVNIKFAEEPRRSGKLKWKQSNTPAEDAVVFLRRMGDPQLNVNVRQFLNLMTPSDADNTAILLKDLYFVSLLSTNAPYVETDKNGNWSFLDVAAGTYSLSVIAPLQADPLKPKSSNKTSDELRSARVCFSNIHLSRSRVYSVTVDGRTLPFSI